MTFTLYSDNTCTTPAGVSGSGAISTSNGVSSASFSAAWTPPAAATFYWRASYAGDANNNPFTTGCGAANEVLVAGPASPTMTTQDSPTSVTVGTATTISDTATFQNTSSVAPTGSVTFTLYSDNTCTTSTGVSGTGAISTTNGVSSATFSTGWVAPATGTYYWRASYAGDAANNGYTTGCALAGELIVVGPASPSLTTQATPTAITVGTATTVGDNATFENTTAVPPTGSLTFTLYSDSACTNSTGVSGPGPITSTGSGFSASFSTGWTAPAAGTYYWRATYPGDSNNNGFTTNCGDANELVVVGQGAPTMATQDSPTSMIAGTTLLVGDTATFQNTTTVVPTGSVMFTLYSDRLCAVPTGVSGPGMIFTTGGVSTASFSTSWTAPAAGAYYWRASYGGDSNNVGFTTGCADPSETIVVSAPAGSHFQTSTTVTTSLTGAAHSGGRISVPAGTAVTDAASLAGGNAGGATGTVSYTVYSDATCLIPVTSGGVEIVSRGAVPMSQPVTFNTPGTYYWRAMYSGDGLNSLATNNCGDEVETVTSSAPSQALDHFLCYTAAPPTAGGPGFKVPANVRLINQFSPGGFVPRIGGEDLGCNPAQKTVPTSVTPVLNPNAHLLCWSIHSATSPHSVVVSNQFGSAKIQTGATSQLCLPSWSSPTTPRTGSPVAPPGLSHFACYAAAYAPGATPFTVPASVIVKDQFSGKQVRVRVGVPKLLCVPSTKVANGVTYPALDPQSHLLCYGVSPTPTRNPVYDENQFGTGKVRILKTNLLCLPSTKVAGGP